MSASTESDEARPSLPGGDWDALARHLSEREHVRVWRPARAPGKVVISGAYAVLEGAPAIVAAVDRHVYTRPDQRAEHVTEEVAAGIRLGLLSSALAFDASALREGDRKLGLGSSAAILVATLASSMKYDLSRAGDLERLFAHAREAHRLAQGGGSGLDVAASVFGGVLCYELGNERAQYRHVELPASHHYEIWSNAESASTPLLLARVDSAKRRHPRQIGPVFYRLRSASVAAVNACHAGDGEALCGSLREQFDALLRLGDIADAAICTAAVHAMFELAQAEGALVVPAGAGGGDVSLYVGRQSPSPELADAMRAHGFRRLGCQLGTPGVRWV